MTDELSQNDRIWWHYKALKKTTALQGFGTNWVWLTLARTHKMPVRKIKDIVKRKAGR